LSEIDYRKYQIIPESKLGALTQAILAADIDGTVQMNMTVYLTGVLKPTKKRRGESHGIILTNGDKSYCVEPELNGISYTGNYIVHE